jgi:hypothetical protein
MKKLLIATAVLMAGAGLALAQSDLPAGAKKEMPGATGGGSTADPTAQPKSSDLAKGAKDAGPEPTTGGSTTDPNAKPMSSDLPAGAQEKMPAADK